MNTLTLISSFVIGTLLFVVFLFLIYKMMYSWSQRTKSQALRIMPLFPIPKNTTISNIYSINGKYIGSTLVPSWNNKITTLGFRNNATLTYYQSGILIQCNGVHVIWIPISSIITIRAGHFIAGKILTHKGIIIVRWYSLLGTKIDTGFHTDNYTNCNCLLEK